jgi:predicted HicB family RNase H-like nuclease
MSDMMEYKAYYGSVSYSDEDAVFHGKIEFIRDLVTFEGTDVKSLRKSFVEAVDDYLDVCRAKNRKPELPFKGSFNVRTGSTLHRKAVLAAKTRGSNLNTIVTEALEKYLSKV